MEFKNITYTDDSDALRGVRQAEGGVNKLPVPTGNVVENDDNAS